MKSINKIILAVALMLVYTSCVNDLDVVPIDPDDQTTATLYDDPSAYEGILAKIYAGLVTTGQQGPAGQGDVAGIDEGFSSYFRQYWYHQELTTEEAVMAWNDQTIKDFHWQTWGAGDIFIQGMYSRIYYQITLANEFLRETTDAKLSDRGVDPALTEEIRGFRSEARFLRALSYWHVLDLFGGGAPFVTEEDAIGAFLPMPTTNQDLFDYVEGELLAIETELPIPGGNEYGRVDQGAVWMLLGKLYLNAQVYIDTDRNSDVITQMDKVINANYALAPEYEHNFLADNHTSPEIIFGAATDGTNSQSWGSTTFIVHAAIGGSMVDSDFGVSGAWGGTRTTSGLVNKFADPSGATDARAMFHTDGQTLEIEDVGVFGQGYAVTKWKNLDQSGNPGSDLTHVDVDFPVFRLADAYLMYAEAVLRGGNGGDATVAFNLVNALRERAYGDTSGNILAGDLTLDFILDERARELYGECHRRTDLIRYGRFSETDYMWPWKGNSPEGASVAAYRDLFPIPSSDLAANPNLIQNEGY